MFWRQDLALLDFVAVVGRLPPAQVEFDRHFFKVKLISNGAQKVPPIGA